MQPRDYKPSNSAVSACYIINLSASGTPPAVKQLPQAEFPNLEFFTSRTREEGRDRFRLHLGYFESKADAQVTLARVRERYPAAWIVAGNRHNPSVALKEVPVSSQATAAPPAPAADLSLSIELSAPPLPAFNYDLELMSDFAAPAPSSAAPVKPVVAAPARADDAFVLFDAPPRFELTLVEDPPPAPIESRPAPTPAIAKKFPVPLKASPPKAPPPKVPTARSLRDTVTLSASQVLRVLEEGAAAAQEPSSFSYAIQLCWSDVPIKLDEIQKSPIFSEYLMYIVGGACLGRRGQGLRLGFFTQAYAAEQVADFLRSDFEQVSIVKVSADERLKAAPALAKPPALRTAPAKPIAALKRAAPRAPLPQSASNRIIGYPAPATANPEPSGVRGWLAGLSRRLG